MNSWKQPIPTNLEETFGSDKPCLLLFVWLIYKSANQDGFFTDKRGKTTVVKRGQVVFGRKRFSEDLGWSEKKVSRTLDKICEIYKKVTKQANTNFTIVSINNYDEIVEMDKQGTSKGQATTTSKSVKSVKIYTQQVFSMTVEEAVEVGTAIGVKTSVSSSEFLKFEDYCRSKGKTYKDYKAAFRNWLRSPYQSSITKTPMGYNPMAIDL